MSSTRPGCCPGARQRACSTEPHICVKPTSTAPCARHLPAEVRVLPPHIADVAGLPPVLGVQSLAGSTMLGKLLKGALPLPALQQQLAAAWQSKPTCLGSVKAMRKAGCVVVCRTSTVMFA